MAFDMDITPRTSAANSAGAPDAASGAGDTSASAGETDPLQPVQFDRAAVKRELAATLAARRELGPEYDPQLIDAFVERMTAQLAARLKPQRAPAHAPPYDQRLGLAITSMALLIPLVAVVLSMGMGLLGLALICLLIVAINLGFRYL
jgi:hypothetical protein